jgi:hypothetical protein
MGEDLLAHAEDFDAEPGDLGGRHGARRFRKFNLAHGEGFATFGMSDCVVEPSFDPAKGDTARLGIFMSFHETPVF